MSIIAVVLPCCDAGMKLQISEKAAALDCEVSFFDTEKEHLDELSRAEIIFGDAPVTASVSQRLRWICLPWAGVSPYCAPGALASDRILLTNSSGAYGDTVAEHAIMAALMLLRRMPAYQEAASRHEWMEPLAQGTLYGCRSVILGAGDIGRSIASRMRPFHPAGIAAVNRSGRSDSPAFDTVLPVADLDRILSDTDLLFSTLPETRDTYHLIGARQLAEMPRNSCLVNVGRAGAIDYDALCDALDAGQLAGAFLDVFAQEPLPPDSRLWTTKNLLLTPHVAGTLTTRCVREKITALFCENLERYRRGQTLKNIVDRERGY